MELLLWAVSPPDPIVYNLIKMLNILVPNANIGDVNIGVLAPA